MEKNFCVECGEEKPLTDFYRKGDYYSYVKCKVCTKLGLDQYSKNGINHDTTTKHLKYTIRNAREVLTRLGYDVEQNIYEQFRERMRKKGVYFKD